MRLRLLTILVVLNWIGLSLSQQLHYNGANGFARYGEGPRNDIFKRSFQPRKVPCTCGVFLDSQCYNLQEQGIPEGAAAFQREFAIPMLPCGERGDNYCQDRCLDEIVPYISGEMGPGICSTIQRNCFREKGNLFIKNCDDIWKATGLTMGREFCCLNGYQVKCPRNWYDEKPTNPSPITTTSADWTESFGNTTESATTISKITPDVTEKAVEIATDVNKTMDDAELV